MDQLIIMQKRFRYLWLLILDIILFIASIVGVVFGIVLNNIILMGVCGGCIVLFILLFVVILKNNLKTRPLLVIYEKGIIDKSTSVAAGYIGWSEIEEVQVFNNDFIAVKVYDLEKIMSRLKPANQANINNNVMHGEPPILIKLDKADKKIEDILKLLQHKLSK